MLLGVREPLETEVGSSDCGNVHAGIDASAKFGAGFLPLLGKPGRQLLQQDFLFFAAEIVSRNHKWREVPALFKASPNVLLLLELTSESQR